MKKAVIIEDEDFAVQRLQMLLKEIEAPVEVVAVLDGIKKAVNWLQTNTIDVIFLDIHLADGNAFKIFEQVEVKVPIIFTTAYHDYALRAFEQHSIDYLLKPVSREKLQQSLSKLDSLQNGAQKESNVPNLTELIDLLKPQGVKRFMVQIGNKIKVLELEEIAYFTSENKITFAITKSAGKRYPIESSLIQLEDTLPQNIFFRVNRKFLLHRQSILELSYITSSRVSVKINPPVKETIIVARERLGQLKKWLVTH